MAYATGWFRVETEVDIADYDGEYEIEFSGIEDIIETADANNYTKEEIVDWCFENGLDMTKYLRDSLDFQTAMELFQQAVDRKVNYFEAVAERRQETIESLRARITELEASNITTTDEEAVKNVAY